MNRILLYFFLALSFGSIQAQDHLLISEVAMTPTSGEFIEIYNPTNSVIPLDNYYLADYNDYFRVVENQLTSTSSDFIVKFPAGASIEPGGILVIAVEGDGLPGADFEIESRSDDVTDMEAIFVGGSAGLTNSAEIVVLFHWDGITDLVQDVDYLAWGTSSDRFVDKTNIAIDGPDAGGDSTFYLPDTPQASQLTVTLPHDVGESFQRISETETDEANNGGNGLTGHNETSENMGASFIIAGSNAGQGFGTPLFGAITQTPENPTEADAVTINATVSDDGTLTVVRLIFSVDGASDSTDMSLLSGSQYEAVIAPQSGGSVVSYSVKAIDDQSNIAVSATFEYTTTVSAPVISNLGISPTSPSPTDEVTVSADVTDNGTISAVTLFYSVNGGNEVNNAMSGNGDTYSATIPAQAEGSQILYYIVAEDNDNNVTTSDPLSYAITVPGEKHLLITEICVTPAANEFVEIHNPTNNTINLSDYYFTDATFAGGSSYYYNIVTGENIGGGTFSDFHARFPQGATIAPGEYQTIAMNGSDYNVAYGTNPTYELYDTNGGITDMLEAGSGSIAGQGGLTDAGEMVVVYFWDGASDLVQDIDYVVWGDKAEAVDKTGIATDGPDADSTPSTYLDDVSIDNQIEVSPDAPHSTGESIQRLSLDEIDETAMGGNGITGHNEMSENLANAFLVFPPSPGSAGPEPGTPIITSITRTPLAPNSEDNVTITAEIIDADGTIVNARLLFSISGVQDSIKMTSTSGDLFEATIAAQPEGTSVAYQVKGFDNDGNIVLSPLTSYTVASSEVGGPHLVFSEIAVQPTAGEFVEIFNPTGEVIDLSNYYFTDATFSGGNFYYNIVGSGDPGGGSFTDFHVRFPAGSSIAPNEAQTIAINGAAFATTYGMEATYEVLSTTPNVTDMREAFAGSIDPGAGLTNAGEVAILYFWDGESDLVKDIDYVVWGDKAEAVDKTGVSIDGPDPDNIPSGYQPDVAIDNQIPLSAEAPHAVGESVQRLNFFETDEIASAGNGITGHNEMSENLAASFSIGIPTPNSAPVPGAPAIDTLYIDPAEPAAEEAVAVNAVIIDADGQIISATLSYSINNGTFIPTTMSLVGADIYQATIPGQATGSVVQYFLEVTDNDDKTAISTTEFYIVGAVDGVIPIAGIQDNISLFLDETVTIEGVITLGAGILIDSRVDAYIQDNSGKGINIFSFDPPDVAGIGIDRFNRVRMTGRITEFGGVTEIADYSLTLLDVNQPTPPPLFVSTNVANDLSFEGTYMKVVGTVADIGEAGGGTNITVQDDKGTVLVRVWGSTGINLSFLNLGDTLSVQGVMDVFESTAQLVPAYQDEITVPGKTARADGSGIVSASIDFVQAADTLANFDIQIIGTIEEPITTIQVDIPKLWEWDGQSADYSLAGAGESAALRVEMAPIDSVVQIFIDNADVALDDTAKISLKNLRTPKDSLNSVFWIRTAGVDGRLSFVNDMPMVNVGGGDRYLIYDIQTRSSLFDGSLTIEGVTTIGAGLLRQTSSAGDSLTTAYIQDESGRGINLFRFGLIDPALVRGNLVSVSGTITEFNGVTEMEYNSISEIAEGAPIPAPLELTNAQVNSPRWDGTLVRTAGVILEQFSAGGGTTFVIGDGNGVTNVRIWDTVGLDLSEYETNNRIFVEGVAGVFVSDEDSIYQLLPTYQDQITLDPTYAPSLADVDLSVPPNPFAPELGETLPIRYNAGEVNNRIVIRIFDLGGRLVLTLLDEQAQIIENVLQWNGLDRLRNRVALGAYVCHLEVVEPFSGKKVSKHAPIVVGTVLSR